MRHFWAIVSMDPYPNPNPNPIRNPIPNPKPNRNRKSYPNLKLFNE